MFNKRLSFIVLLVLSAVTLSLISGGATAQEIDPQRDASVQANVGTAFTYQGKLTDGGSPASGDYDFEFELHDDPTADSQVGSTITVDDQTVTDGLFTVELDFGSVFTGTARYLEIGVRSSDSSGSYTVLDPRQPLKPSPYALALPGVYTQESPFFVGVGREERITSYESFGVHSPATGTNYGGMYIETAGGNTRPFYGYAIGSDAKAWHYYDGSTEEWRLYNGGVRLTVDSEGNVGVGTADPVETLDVAGSIRSTADTTIEVSPFDMIESDGLSRLSFAAKYTGRMEVTNNGSAGERYVYVPVSIPSTLHGTQQKLKSLYFCYSLPTLGDVLLGQIMEASVRQVDESFSGSTLLFTDDVPIVAPERCLTVSASAPSDISGSIWIRFKLDMAANSTIDFGRIALTLTSE